MEFGLINNNEQIHIRLNKQDFPGSLKETLLKK